MGYFNHNDFKYIIKRIIIILGVLIIASMFKKVFGYTNFTASNGKTYRIPDYPKDVNNYIVYVRQNKSNNWYYVFYYGTDADYMYLNQAQSVPYYLRIRSGSNYNSSFTINSRSYSAQTLSSAGNFTSNTTETTTYYNIPFGETSYDYFIVDSKKPINVYQDTPNTTLIENYYTPPNYSVEPYIENNSTDIESWTFENLSINYGTLNYDSRDYLRVTYFDSVTGQNYGDFDLNLSFYTEKNDSDDVIMPINIIQQRLNNSIVFKDTFKIGFILVHFTDDIGNADTYSLSDSPYTVSISSTYADDLNNNADRSIQNDILNETQKTNTLIGDLNNNLTSSDIDENAISFPTVDVQDGRRT